MSNIDEQEFNRRMDFARFRTAQAWCTEETKEIVMIPQLAEAFARILVEEMYSPKLGCATTEEIIDELKARVDCHYSTIGGSHVVGK